MFDQTVRFVLVVLALLMALSVVSCGGDSSDDDDDDNNVPDDDATPDDDDDATPDDDDVSPDDDDDDTVAPTPVPTTLDLILQPVESGEGYELTLGPGEPHTVRNDLAVDVSRESWGERLSIGYFLTLTDQHVADEEAPTRLAFYKSWEIFFGIFESFFRAQEDLTPQILNAMVRTAYRIQADYGRSFDLALVLGDVSDNAQRNELYTLLDVLDGAGLVAGEAGVVRPDSGDWDIDPESGFNYGERDFGAQQVNTQGENINAFDRPGQPNSNADFFAEGLRDGDGGPLPWYTTPGNHDVLGNGGFDPDTFLSCFTRDDYTGGLARMGYIPGLAGVVQYLLNHPGESLYIGCGLIGLEVDWRDLYVLMLLGGAWWQELDPRFDLMTLVNDTPLDASDDGVHVTADPDRVYVARAGMIPLMHEHGHGFVDRNNDGEATAADGGWYRLDWPDAEMPLRVLMVDSSDICLVSEGGLSKRQLDWLEAELAQAMADDVLVVLASHHHEEEIIVGLRRFEELVHACPNVIMHLVGHDHRNKIVPHPAPDLDPARGYWEVQTPSTVEFPQQGRIVEIVDNRDGTGSIYLTLFDHWPIVGDDADALAGLGREIAAADGRMSLWGDVTDRNAELIFAIPPAVADRLSWISSDGEITSTDSLGTLRR